MSYQGMCVLIIFILCKQESYGTSALDFSVSDLEGRIVKGIKVGIDQYPHAVFLHLARTVPKVCGGSLITVNVIITAADCLEELRYRNGTITALFGAAEAIHSEVARRISNYRIHPHFNPDKGKFNLGLAYFRKRVPLGSHIQKIPIAVDPPRKGDILFTCGWGKQVPKKIPDYSQMRHLKALQHRVVSTRVCERLSGLDMSSSYWCTASVDGYHYHGDLGNGLVTEKSFLIGVVSYIINNMTVYSDVIHQNYWISTSLKELAKDHCNKSRSYIKSTQIKYESKTVEPEWSMALKARFPERRFRFFGNSVPQFFKK